ncbi:MAG: STAS domain-containing protein [Spirochaetes bacterium]|nr:STAS domain-containing protein [Spirochaetota bacterium]
MDFTHHCTGAALVLVMPEKAGRLAESDLNVFIDDIRGIITPSITTVALDMSRHDFMNSTGLGELVRLKDSLIDSNIELALINCSPRVASLLDMAGVDRFVKIVNSEDELLQR